MQQHFYHVEIAAAADAFPGNIGFVAPPGPVVPNFAGVLANEMTNWFQDPDIRHAQTKAELLAYIGHGIVTYEFDTASELPRDFDVYVSCLQGDGLKRDGINVQCPQVAMNSGWQHLEANGKFVVAYLRTEERLRIAEVMFGLP